MDMREEARAAFQRHLDELQQPDGFTLGFGEGGSYQGSYFQAGMRVLSATPLFDRATGEVERWRYWLLFAEMGILDRFGGGHPVHVFECDVRLQKAHHVELQEVGTDRQFRLCRNDPHSLDERQERVYKAWDKAVREYGGEAALQALLDRKAAEWTEQLLASGEMK